VATKKTAIMKSAGPKKVAKRPATKKSAAKPIAKKKTVAKKAVTKRAVKKKTSGNLPMTKRPRPQLESPAFANAQFSNPSNSLPSVFETKSTTEVKTSESNSKLNASLLLLLVGTLFVLAFAVFGAASSDESLNEIVNKEEFWGSEVVLAPATNVYATYTSTGGVITWSKPDYIEGLTGYIVQAAYADSEFVDIATLGAEQSSLGLVKIDTPGYTAYRVVTVFQEGEVFSQESIIRGKYRTGS
jgi:hypothetical protein